MITTLENLINHYVLRDCRFTFALSNTPEHGPTVRLSRMGPNGSPAGWGPLPAVPLTRWGSDSNGGATLHLPALSFRRAYQLRHFGALALYRWAQAAYARLGVIGYRSAIVRVGQKPDANGRWDRSVEEQAGVNDQLWP